MNEQYTRPNKRAEMTTTIKPAELKETTAVKFRRDGMNCNHRTHFTGRNTASPENSRAVDTKNSKATARLSGFRIVFRIPDQ